MSELGVSRRNLICGFVAAGVAVPLVAACGSSGSSSSSGTPSSGGAPSGGIKTSDIPVGGGKVFPDQNIVVTQPKAGEFKAFSSHCTHQGTTLNAPVNGVMTCPLHGSEFSAENGDNVRGPSGGAAGTTPNLPELTVKVTGATLTVS